MASGIEMLFKMLNLDPNEIKGAVSSLAQAVTETRDTMRRIEANQLTIIGALRDAGLVRGDDTAGSGDGVAEGGSGRPVPLLKQ